MPGLVLGAAGEFPHSLTLFVCSHHLGISEQIHKKHHESEPHDREEPQLGNSEEHLTTPDSAIDTLERLKTHRQLELKGH
jgi:hypothetical protein